MLPNGSLDELRQAQDQHRSRLQQLKGQESSLQALQDAASSDAEAKQLGEWLDNKQVLRRGALFEKLTVDDGWAAAVEQVLGDALTGTCIDNIDALTANLNEVPAGATLFDASIERLANDQSLAAVVQGPRALRSWLANVRRANTLNEALALLPTLEPQASVITPDGQWLGHGWARTRSKADAATGVIERRELLATVVTEIAGTQVALKNVEQDLEQARAMRAQLEATLGSTQLALKEAVREQADLSAERKTRVGAIEQYKQRRHQLDTDLTDAKQQFEAEQAALVDARAQLATAIDAMETDGAERERLLAQRDECRAALQLARDGAREARDESHKSDVRSQNLRTQVATVESTIVRLEQQVEQLEVRQRELTTLLPESDEPDEALKAQLETLLEQRVEAEAALADARQTASDKEHAVREQEQAKVAVEHRLQQTHSQIEQVKLRQAERHVRVENLESQFRELEVGVQQVVETLPNEANEPEWQVKVERIAAKINRLGPINLAAIDECARASERKNYLDAQNADLESALGTLENAIRKIDKETRSRFQETFDQVNAGFSELFPRVFGGGTASLEMTGDDLLDTGVAIMARPPGKKNSTIHLLSGGEKP